MPPHKPTTQRARGAASAALLALLALGLAASTVPVALVPPPVLAQAPAGFTLPPITLIFPTPTRTPTPINVGNFVWDDIDHDGRQDGGEPGLAGVTVQLWNSSKTQLIDSDVTDGNGLYTVVAPTPGNYRVRVLLPNPSDQFSPKDQAGGDDTDDSDINDSGTNAGFTDIYNFASNLISITSIDAGIVVFRTPTPTRTPTPINVGNFVWHDLNANGIQEGGEPGVAGVWLQLWSGDKTILFDEAVTNGNGNYTLVAPLPGDYRVRVILTSGVGLAPLDQGGDDTEDSDIITSLLSSNRGFTNIYSFASNLISITSIDAGLTGVPANWPTATASLTPTASRTPTRTPTPTGVAALYEIFAPLVTR